MKLRAAPLLVLAVLQLGQAAGAPAAPATEPSAAGTSTRELPGDRAALAGRLDEIVDRAINARVLTPPGGDAPAEEEIGEGSAPLAVAEAMRPPTECPSDDPIDLSDVRKVSRYQDLKPFDPKAGTAGEDEEGSRNLTLAKAKAEIALGLNAEAAVTLRALPAAQSEPLAMLVRLMERRQAPDAAYFEWLSGCHESARFWLAAALLADGRQEGAGLIALQMNAFRTLPVHLRADVAALVVPSLNAIGEIGLSQKLIAGFSEDEIAETSRLQFCEALIELQQGRPDADARVRGFLRMHEFRIDALSALEKRKADLSPLERAVFADEMTTVISRETRTPKRTFALGFVLGEIDATSDYERVHALAALPSLQSGEAKAEIRTRFAASLQRDLEGEDALRKLLALDAMINESGLLGDDDSYAGLFALGEAEATSLGQGIIARQLGLKAKGAGSEAAHRAREAFAAGDDATLHALARSAEASQHMILLAALRAINTGDNERLKAYEPKLSPHPDAIVALIEEDALAGSWMVSESVYDSARAIGEAGLAARVDRVMAIKAAAAASREPSAPGAMADIAGTLTRSGIVLENLMQETP